MTTAERIAEIRARVETIGGMSVCVALSTKQVCEVLDDLKWACAEIERQSKRADDAEQKLGESDRAIYQLVKDWTTELYAARGEAK